MAPTVPARALPPSPFRRFAWLCAALLIVSAAARAGAKLPPELAAQLPAAVTRPVDFGRDIRPIFEASCVQCHGHGKSKGSFSLETRADFLAGGDAGAPVTAGRSDDSYLIDLISGLDPEIVMPQKGKKLTREQVAIVRGWIDQGMPWPDEFTFARAEPANLKPRAITPPPAKPGLENPLDRLVDKYFAAHQMAWPTRVDDRIFARRAWLDTVGLLPSPEELAAFIGDRSPDKRAALVQRLLSDNQRYAEHWLTFWNDLLRNDYRGTGFTDGGRKQISNWIYTALARNLPYDRLVADLIDPGAEAEGFTRGIIWRGVVNASQVPPMQAAQGIAQVFLGVNLKCASCHDSFINDYTLEDSYGLASIYANGPLQIAECDKPTGVTAPVKFLYQELGAIEPGPGKPTPKQQLVDIITGRQNGRLPRTIVNRLWQRFLGHGLVEPVDEMDKAAWSPEVIDWLAEDFVAHGYDLKHLMTRILTSRAYQLPSVSLGEAEANYVFRGPAVRRMNAEQFNDAITSVAGLTHARVEGRINRPAALQGSVSDLPLAPKWIWDQPSAAVMAPPATTIFRRVINLAVAPTEAQLAICADDNYAVRVNGRNAGSSGRRNTTLINVLDLMPHLKAGENSVEVTVANMPPDDGRLEARMDPFANVDSPAGVIFYGRIRAASQVMDFVSDRSWMTLADIPPINDRFAVVVRIEPVETGPAVELGGIELAPWKVGRALLELAAAPRDTLPVTRASLVGASPLMAALGRPNREQIVTVRQNTATTLQALELTNGATLAALLTRASEKILASQPADSRELVLRLYQHTLGRSPSTTEANLANELVGSPLRAGGVEDLLWSLAMLPEFQLIR